MKPTTRQIASLLSIFFLLGLSTFNLQAKSSSTNSPDSILLEKAEHIRYSFPDSSSQLLEKCHLGFLKSGDTLNAVRALTLQANIIGNLANYKDAYDKLWLALYLSDMAGLDREKAQLYIEIGRHYSYYKRRLKALEYFQISHEIIKELIRDQKVSKAELVSNYYAFCSTYRELGEFRLARTYLDSCFMYYDDKESPIKNFYLQFELGCIQGAEGNHKQAVKTFLSVKDWFETNDPSYLVLFYTYLGDANFGSGNYNESEVYYKKALEISGEYNMHIDFSVLIHEKLSELYLQKGNYPEAFRRLKTVKELDAKFFDSRSDNNQSLLGIQDAFRKQQEEQQKLLQRQKLEQLEHQEDVWFLQRIILIVSLLFLVSTGMIYFKYMAAKYRAEKQVIRKEKELELRKANEVLEIKNKELAASALKLIEKDENLALLKSKIRENNGKVDVSELKKVVRSISISNDRNWEEFEARFVDVNQSFYNSLQEQFPKLSQRDLKLCALIKLNFSSKEMAKLLGISVESAHTSRYRLRKKLGLTRNVNLTEFIANI